MLDVYSVLLKLEEFKLLKTHRKVGNYMQIYCPFHNDGNEKKPSCGVLLHEEVRGGRKYPQGFCHCFACGFAKSLPDTITELLKIHNINENGMNWLLQNIPDFDGDLSDIDLLIPQNVMEEINSRYMVNYLQNITQKKQVYISEKELASYRFIVPYMYERKLTNEIIEKFDIGYDANWIAPGRKKPTPCITFPVRDINGNTLFFCRRSIKGKLFNYPTGVTKPVYGLFELPKGCKSVIICESCFNALTCYVYGKPAVALLGTGNSYQIEQLKRLGVQEFILALDPDEAGKKGTERLKYALKNVAIVWEFSGIPTGKDINDLTREEFENLELI